MIARRHLHLVAGPRASQGETSWADVCLLAFLLAIHAVPVGALAAGGSWGMGLQGYATAVVVFASLELARELRANLRHALSRKRR